MRELERALVVGGGGFFGGWVVDELQAQGVGVTVIDPIGAADGVDCIKKTLEEVDLAALFDDRSIDAVFHLAGVAFVPWSLEHPLDDLALNAGGTIAVLEAARRAATPPVVALASSAAVYGEGVQLPIDESHPLVPLSPYGVSKLAAEHYVRLYTHLYGLATFAVRPFSLYGPRQRKLVVHDLIVRVLGGEDPLTLAAAPDVSRDFVFVRDGARAIVALARSAPALGEAYNVASGRSTTLAELADAVVAACGASADVEFTGTVRAGDPVHWAADASRAAALDVRCDTSLEEGLRATVEWLRA